MSEYVARQAIRLLIKAEGPVNGADVLVLGATVKENVPDPGNARVVELVRELQDYGMSVSVHDPLLDKSHFEQMKLNWKARFDAIILVLPHRIFRDHTLKSYVNVYKNNNLLKPLVNVKGVLPVVAGLRDIVYWSL